MKKDMTELIFILDRSGSMAPLVEDTVGGYNAMLESSRSTEGKALVTTVLFNHETKVLCDRVPISKIQPMKTGDYVPRGCTALLDAIGETLKDAKRVQEVLPKSHRAKKVLVAIATDGLENCSSSYTYDQVKHMILDAQERGWEFIFMAANIDAAAEAGRIGIRSERAMQYEATPQGTADMFCAAACACQAVLADEPLDGWKNGE